MTAELAVTRLSVDPVDPPEDANIRRRYAAEAGGWVWHPKLRADEPACVVFMNSFELVETRVLTLHVSADQRYRFWVDQTYVGKGPDRSDPMHWAFASYQIELPAGPHLFTAEVWWLGEAAPAAQMSLRGGLLWAVEGEDALAQQLTTGAASASDDGGSMRGWWCATRDGWQMHQVDMGSYHVIGPSMHFDVAQMRASTPAEAWQRPAVVRGPIHDSGTGIIRPGWRLHPSGLPDMLHEPRQLGRIRAVLEGDAGREAIPQDATEHAEQPAWQALIDASEPVTVQPGQTRQVILDLENYFCGYTTLRVAGGTAAQLDVQWAESLFRPEPTGKPQHKDHRDEVADKAWFGFGDRWTLDGNANQLRSQWWRSGRYLRLTVHTAQDPLIVQAWGFEETRCPVEQIATWQSDDAELDAITPLAVRGIQMCAHETFMDCPYYEQLMYVGDTRLQALTLYTMQADDALVRRGIELFDFSRWATGLVAERYPSNPQQVSPTFALLWVSMLRDYAYWRGEEVWTFRRLIAARAVLEQFYRHRSGAGLLIDLPGWPFVDWVPQWPLGCAPGSDLGLSCVPNLLYIQALRHAADVEAFVGEAAMAQRYRDLADQTAEAVVDRFWSEPRGGLADDPDRTQFSEHAQSLALLHDVLPEEARGRCVELLLEGEDLARATVYFSFYLFEALYHLGRGDLLHEKLGFWKDLVTRGFKTPVEKPEPSRSDCHGWGSHPLFHFHASLAGIRPIRSGFGGVRIAPDPGPLKRLHSEIPTPQGPLSLTLRRDPWPGGGGTAEITLPESLPGEFVYGGETWELAAGHRHTVEF